MREDVTPPPTARIGVMGGMFDPVHSGHLQAALTALRLLELDQLRLVPCHVPNHRALATASSAQRLAMLHLAVSCDPRLRVDAREVERAGVSYTVDTLASLRADFPASTLVLVLGADAFAGLASWHRWREIFALAHLLVISRPLASAVQQPLVEGLAVELKRRQVASVEALFARSAGAILMTDELQVDISSTQVRNLLHDGRGTDTLLPAAVAQYIEENQLYR